MTIETINPTTGKVINTYTEMTKPEFDKIIDSTHQAYLDWRKTSFQERSQKMLVAAEILRTNKTVYAKLMAEEMGKPLAAGQGEIEKCAWVCEYYAENAEKHLASEMIETEMAKSYRSYSPLGIVFAIMPWNFPFWQVFRFLAPTLMAGNGALLKHAPICTGTGFAIEEIIKQAGFPENLFRHLVVDNEGAAEVIRNSKVIAVTLTGSERAGQAVGAEAAGNLKKVVLELGGCDPYVILEDADLEKAAEAIVTSRLSNSGQVCIAAKRVIAVDAVHDKLKDLVLQKLDRFVMGDPLQPHVNFGPLARKDIRDEVHSQVQQSIAAGAKLIAGGEIPDDDGFYYPPTMLVNIKKGMLAYDKEIFGPVVAFLKAADEQEAIEIANDTPYGLGGAVFTEDLARGERIARDEIQSGACFVNTFVASDPRLPFGGIYQSGYGRELSKEGIREFMNLKTVCIK